VRSSASDASLDIVFGMIALLAVVTETLLGHLPGRRMTEAREVPLFLVLAVAGACAAVVGRVLEPT